MQLITAAFGAFLQLDQNVLLVVRQSACKPTLRHSVWGCLSMYSLHSYTKVCERDILQTFWQRHTRRLSTVEDHLFVCCYYKKLSYCRDSAGRRLLRRSRSFKVIGIGTNWKHVCNFLLMNITNLYPISHHLPGVMHYWSDYRFWQRGVYR